MRLDMQVWLIHVSSLIPRPFPPPVFFIVCSMQNGGGRPGRKSHMRDVRWDVRGGGA